MPNKLLILFFFVAILSSAFANQYAALVETSTINLKEFDAEFMYSVSEYKKNMLINEADSLSFSELEKLKYTILEGLINNKLFENYANKNKIKITDREVNTNIAALESNYANKAEFWDNLQKKGINKEALTERVRTKLIKERVIAVVYPESQLVTTEDIIIHLKKSVSYMLPVEYNLTLVVTSNISCLERMKREGVTSKNWNTFGLNKDLSYQNTQIMDEYLPEKVIEKLDLVALNEFSEPSSLEDEEGNYFAVKINKIGSVDEEVTKGMTDALRAALLAEKKNRYIEKWLQEQKEKAKITINYKIYPNYYHGSEQKKRKVKEKPWLIKEGIKIKWQNT